MVGRVATKMKSVIMWARAIFLSLGEAHTHFSRFFSPEKQSHPLSLQVKSPEGTSGLKDQFMNSILGNMLIYFLTKN